MDDQTKAFLVDLKKLLDKHKVEITASDEYMGFPECGEDIQIKIEGDVNSLGMDLDRIEFGSYIDSDKLSGMLKGVIKNV